MSRQVAPVEVVEDVSPEPAPMAPVSASDEKYAAPAPVSSPTPPVDASPPVQKLVEQADEPQEPHIELVQSPILADARHITYNCVYCQHTSDDTVAAQRHLETCLEKPIRYPCCHCPAISKTQLQALEHEYSHQAVRASHPSSSKLRILGKSLDNHYLQSISTNLLNLNCSTDVNQGDIANELVPTKHRVVPRQRTRASQPLFGTHVV